MNMRVDIKKIGFYKYETKNLPIVDCVKEYPLTPEIQDYISKNYHSVRLDYDNSEPRVIDGKFVVLI